MADVIARQQNRLPLGYRQSRRAGTYHFRNTGTPTTDLGYYEGAIDGIYGPKTAEAVREYQRVQGLSVTGRLNQETAQALQIGEADETAETTLASGAVGAAAGATLGVMAGSAAVGAAIGGPVGLAAGALGASLWTQLRDAF